MAKRSGINSPLYWFTLLGFDPCPRPKPDGYVPHIASVYVICAGDSAVKVGVSINPGARARNLQTGQDRIVRVFWAVMLEYSDAYRLEKEVHDKLRRTVGGASGEWFYIAPETAVAAIQAQLKSGDFWAEPDPVYGLFREGAVS
jgi:hypothetical protein